MNDAIVSSGLGAHLPALQVVVPLMAAALCALLRNRSVVWGWATLVGWSTFGMAVVLLRRVLADGPISYAMGDWPPP
ncbi:MAG: hypothetical protein R3223_00170, partial [Longimicrobiales bacterium]|nr:hypothetical protein [Longimicrobiales bacterium]